ncbi:stevor PIR protein,putative [Plasmodium sp. DRC-Itaito]|nr:stevor PIR protein,putative [Plasmodium sp. DRC-Itaito]
MNTYYLKMLIFSFLMNILVLPDYENCEKSHYNRSLIKNNTQRTTIKSRLLAQTQNHNPHYHNDPELKEMIDKLNEEAIKKYQQTHDPYEQLKELVEKNGTRSVGGYGTEPMSTEKDLFETYEEVFGQKNDIMLKSGKYPNDDDKSDKSLSCECTENNNMKLGTTKGKDKYLVNLKERCKGGIGFCSVGSVLLTLIGLIASKAAALGTLTIYEETIKNCVYSVSIFKIFQNSAMLSALQASGTTCANAAFLDLVTPATTAALGAFPPYGIAALVLLVLAVVLIILYIWLYRRRKNSWKHECKKHLCK